MLDPKKLLNDLLGSQLPGGVGDARNGATKVTQMAKDNPLATGALVAVLLGTKTGRNGRHGDQARRPRCHRERGLQRLQELSGRQRAGADAGPADGAAATTCRHGLSSVQSPQGETEFALTLVRAMIAAANADGHIDETERKHRSQTN